MGEEVADVETALGIANAQLQTYNEEELGGTEVQDFALVRINNAISSASSDYEAA